MAKIPSYSEPYAVSLSLIKEGVPHDIYIGTGMEVQQCEYGVIRIVVPYCSLDSFARIVHDYPVGKRPMIYMSCGKYEVGFSTWNPESWNFTSSMPSCPSRVEKMVIRAVMNDDKSIYEQITSVKGNGYGKQHDSYFNDFSSLKDHGNLDNYRNIASVNYTIESPKKMDEPEVHVEYERIFDLDLEDE